MESARPLVPLIWAHPLQQLLLLTHLQLQNWLVQLIFAGMTGCELQVQARWPRKRWTLWVAGPGQKPVLQVAFWGDLTSEVSGLRS